MGPTLSIMILLGRWLYLVLLLLSLSPTYFMNQQVILGLKCKNYIWFLWQLPSCQVLRKEAWVGDQNLGAESSFCVSGSDHLLFLRQQPHGPCSQVPVTRPLPLVPLVLLVVSAFSSYYSVWYLNSQSAFLSSILSNEFPILNTHWQKYLEQFFLQPRP